MYLVAELSPSKAKYVMSTLGTCTTRFQTVASSHAAAVAAIKIRVVVIFLFCLRVVQ
jgi:hypothetical protein